MQLRNILLITTKFSLVICNECTTEQKQTKLSKIKCSELRRSKLCRCFMSFQFRCFMRASFSHQLIIIFIFLWMRYLPTNVGHCTHRHCVVGVYKIQYCVIITVISHIQSVCIVSHRDINIMTGVVSMITTLFLFDSCMYWPNSIKSHSKNSNKQHFQEKGAKNIRHEISEFPCLFLNLIHRKKLNR